MLERWKGPSIGITGTAGKTTTTALVASILRRAGVDIAVSSGARAGNLWPTADLLERIGVEADGAGTTLLLELTSSHLAFMRSSPTLAAVISFWPDHLELHGTLEEYRAAKAQIVRCQHPGDRVVVNADDASAAFADATPAGAWEISLSRQVERGAFLDRERGVVVTDGTTETVLGQIEDSAAHPANIVAAAAIATAAGADPRTIAPGLDTAVLPPWRAEPAGTLGGVPVLDDGMAATPTKGAATLARYPAGSVVLIAGGLNDAGGGTVHAAPAENALLEQACDVIARVARVVVLFGEAGQRLAPLLARRSVELIATSDLGRRSPPLRSERSAPRQWCSHRCSPSRSATGSASPRWFVDPADAGLRLVDRGRLVTVVEVRLHVLLQQPESQHGKKQALEHLRAS